MVGGIYGALIMKGKEVGTIVEQMPCRLYESSDISIPHKLHDNSNKEAPLLTRISGHSKYLATPFQADFDNPAEQAITVPPPNQFLSMVLTFISALAGSIVFILKKIW